MTRFTAYEFFAGGGMARIGLGPGWDVLFANDLDPRKCAAYRVNFGDAHLIEADIHDLGAQDLPGRADLAWASFPCQDLSLAGARSGFAGGRSAAFWGFWSLMRTLDRAGRAPRTLVIENVVGFATSRGGQDLDLALSAIAGGGYRFDVRVIDAAAFVPQSRPRLFIIAWRADEPGAPPIAAAMGVADRDPLSRALARLSPAARAGLAALPLPPPPRRNIGLDEIVEADAPVFDAGRREALLALCAPLQKAKIEGALREARAEGAPRHGALFRRMRNGVQRAEVRFDMAGCLRTPAGGSSKQVLVIARPDGRVDARHATPREAARLMGLPEDYELPGSVTQALKLAGDGVAAPVVRHIAEHGLEPLLRGDARASLEPPTAAE